MKIVRIPQPEGETIMYRIDKEDGSIEFHTPESQVVIAWLAEGNEAQTWE